jgi:hypothetical protein
MISLQYGEDLALKSSDTLSRGVRASVWSRYTHPSRADVNRRTSEEFTTSKADCENLNLTENRTISVTITLGGIVLSRRKLLMSQLICQQAKEWPGSLRNSPPPRRSLEDPDNCEQREMVAFQFGHVIVVEKATQFLVELVFDKICGTAREETVTFNSHM